MDLVRQISALALVVTLSLIGLPLPIHAADEESRVVADGRALTVHGQPLWRLRNAASGAFSLASLLGAGHRPDQRCGGRQRWSGTGRAHRTSKARFPRRQFNSG